VWYTLNAAYNIFNKRVVNVIKLSVTVGTLHLLVGMIYSMIVWGLRIRDAPRLSWNDTKLLLPIAFFNMLGHISACISLAAGAVSFTHIVKSAEPVFTSLFAGLFLRQVFPWYVYAALFPIIAGVAITSITEVHFKWISFVGAMVSNLAFSLRAIFSKAKMQKPVGKNLNPMNLFALLTILSFFMSVPVALILEYDMVSVYKETFKNSSSKEILTTWLNVVWAGLTYQLYNEVAFLALNEIHPITHAVGNTVKRVVIIVASLIVFGDAMTPLGATGCTIAILGTLIYSLLKSH